jgi:hypothetical protein
VEWSGVEWSGVEWSGVEWSGVVWMDISQDRDQWSALVNMILNLPVP